MNLFIHEFDVNSKTCGDPALDSAFTIATCQRNLVMSTLPLSHRGANRIFEGAKAYEFLLRFACGLESQIKGETDVFGQLRLAFKEFSLTRPEAAASFQGLFSKVLEDTKEIRAHYLHGIGGNTYGALARRLLNPSPTDKVLLIGAGQISKSVAPYFADSHLTIYNRSLARLLELESELSKKGYTRIQFIHEEPLPMRLIQEATLILICTPPDSPLDQRIIEGTASETSHAKIFHFGAQAPDLTAFQNAEHLRGRISSLTELFAMEKTQGSLRDRQVSQAIKACRHRAILRSMSRSIHIAHGWEDLSAFF